MKTTQMTWQQKKAAKLAAAFEADRLLGVWLDALDHGTREEEIKAQEAYHAVLGAK